MKQKGGKNNRKRIYNYLWKYRKEMGYSQRDVADILGHKDQSLICKWEKGVKNPNLVNAIKLSILYRIPVTFIFKAVYESVKDEIRAREEEKSRGAKLL